MSIVLHLETKPESLAEINTPQTSAPAIITEINNVQPQPSNSKIRRAHSLGDAIDYHANTPPPPILIRGIKVGSIGFIYGVPKSGKTTYTEHLCISIAAGRAAFNGYHVVCPNRI